MVQADHYTIVLHHHHFPHLISSLSPSSQVFGGSGSYQWSLVENNGVISVSTVGVVTILAQGSSSVKVTDQKNSHHFVIIKVQCVDWF